MISEKNSASLFFIWKAKTCNCTRYINLTSNVEGIKNQGFKPHSNWSCGPQITLSCDCASFDRIFFGRFHENLLWTMLVKGAWR